MLLAAKEIKGLAWRTSNACWQLGIQSAHLACSTGFVHGYMACQHAYFDDGAATFPPYLTCAVSLLLAHASSVAAATSAGAAATEARTAAVPAQLGSHQAAAVGGSLPARHMLASLWAPGANPLSLPAERAPQPEAPPCRFKRPRRQSRAWPWRHYYYAYGRGASHADGHAWHG